MRIYNGATFRAGSAPKLLAESAPFAKLPGGVRLALVDVNGDGVNELIAAPALNGSKVKLKAFRLQAGAPAKGIRCQRAVAVQYATWA